MCVLKHESDKCEIMFSSIPEEYGVPIKNIHMA